MKTTLKLGIAALGLALSPMAASAADLPVAPAPMPAPVFTWTGFYLGVHAGFAWADVEVSDINGYGGGAARFDLQDGGVAGVQAGFNWQFRNLVIGIEGDASWVDLDGSVAGPVLAGNTGAPPGIIYGSDVEAMATVRGRLGFAADRFMFYLTGGAAWADWNHSAVDVFGNQNIVAGNGNGNGDDDDWGWTIGLGGEIAVTNWLSLKAEYLVAFFDDAQIVGVHTSNGVAQNTFAFNFEDRDIHVVKIGANFRFPGLFGVTY